MSATPRALSLRLWLLASHALVLALPVVVLVGTGSLAQDLRAQTEVELQVQADLIGLFVARELAARTAPCGAPPCPPPSLASLGLTPTLVEARQRTLASVRVVDARGTVVATSGEELGLDLSDRPEVAAALEGGAGLEVRPRPPATRSQPIDSPSRRAPVRLFLGSPIALDGRTVGAVVLSRTPREEVQALYQLVPWWVAALPLGITLAVAWGIGRIASRSLVRLESVSRRIADGAFGATAELDRPGQSRIAEVRGLTAAFQHMAARLQSRLAYISEFAAHVSHEFKTPITTLRGTVELIRDDDEMPATQRTRFLDNAIAELDRLERLVTGLLTLARAEQGAEPREVELDEVVAGVAARHAAPVRGQAGRVRGHRDQLAAAVDNLLDNARRHGGPRVEVVLWRQDGWCGVDVRDDGPGISPANLPRVFDRFFTTARDRGGTGLGLALVKAVCVSHGGEVAVRSQPGETVFSCRFPVVDA